MKSLPWFRAYTEMVDDEKLRLLAFEDRWHFVALLCLKGQGVLDETGPLLFRKVAVKLGLDVRSVEEVARRLSEVGLIDEKTLQPIAWEARQFRSDSSAARVAAYRERKKQGAKRDGNVTVTAQDTDTDKEEEKKEELPRKRSNTFVVPDWINKTHWDAWHSCAKRKNASDAQKQMAVDKLDAWRKQGIDHAAALENAAIAGWQGLFKPDVPAAAMTPGRRSAGGQHKYAAAAAAIFDFDDNPAQSGPSEVIDV